MEEQEEAVVREEMLVIERRGKQGHENQVQARDGQVWLGCRAHEDVMPGEMGALLKKLKTCVGGDAHGLL